MTRVHLVYAGAARLANASRRLPPKGFAPTLRQITRTFSSHTNVRLAQLAPRLTRATAPLQATRFFSASAIRAHGHIHKPKPGEELYITFVDKDGDSHKLAVAPGDNLLDIAQAHDLEMEGACGGSCACSTCHVIVEDEAYFDKMNEPDDDENDMLDLAFGLTETSRLGCQVMMTKELDGLVVRLPTMTRNLQASDFESK
ncbi:MAG: mitochondrial matrix iron-sulfur protein [Sporothrix epigloea]